MNDDSENELNKFSHRIGKPVHDAWVDSKVRNLSVDVIEALETQQRKRKQRMLIGIPAFVGTLGIILMVVFYHPTQTIVQTADTASDTFTLSESDVSAALVSDLTDDEIIDLIADDPNTTQDLLTEQDIDVLFKE